MSYYSLPRVILNENNKETKKLNNLSSNYSDLFYKQLAQDLDEDIPPLVSQQIVTEGALLLTDDVQNFLLGTSEYANDIQSDIGLFVTKARFNEASVTHKHDPIVKGVWRTENRLALHFKDVATFGAQNPIIGSLLREIDLKKKGRNSDLIRKQLEKALDINDAILIQRFKKFKDDPINFNNSDDKNDNDEITTNQQDNLLLHQHLMIFQSFFKRYQQHPMKRHPFFKLHQQHLMKHHPFFSHNSNQKILLIELEVLPLLLVNR